MEIFIKDRPFQVDPEDAVRLLVEDWNINAAGYLVRHEGGKAILFHRLVTSAEDGVCVDHINGDASDDRKENLRFCTHTENMQNRKVSKNSKSGVRGVYWCRKGSKWRAEISAHGKKRNLGRFTSLEEAASAYAEAARLLHGEFARPTIM